MSTIKINGFKDIHLGSLIRQRVYEMEIDTLRICNFLKCNESDIIKMYEAESLDSKIILRWSKLLQYDFFRIYTQHLILYAPVPSGVSVKKSNLPLFRKNIYTQEVIDFILELLQTGEKTKQQIMDDYRIPKTTLYKWIDKFKK